MHNFCIFIILCSSNDKFIQEMRNKVDIPVPFIIDNGLSSLIDK